MRKKHLFLLPAFACAFQNFSLAQDRHPALAEVASKIDTKAEYVKLNKIDEDLAVAAEYLEASLEMARKNGEIIPEDLKVKEVMELLGLNTLKAYGISCSEVDNAWVNLSYLDLGGRVDGIFSLLGEKNQDYIVPRICPEGTDVAIQLQLDFKKIEPALSLLAETVGEGEMLGEAMNKRITRLGITTSELLSKLDVRVNLMAELDDSDAIPVPYVAVRIDGVAWLWEKIVKGALKKAGVDVVISEENGKIIIRPKEKIIVDGNSESTQGVKLLENISIMAIVDVANNHLWISSDEAYLSKCMSSGDKLVDSVEFKEAMEGLPSKANTMAYVSKSLLNKTAKTYSVLSKSGMLGEDFEKVKSLTDRIIDDLTDSDKGWALTVSVDDQGILVASRLPMATKHIETAANHVEELSLFFPESIERLRKYTGIKIGRAPRKKRKSKESK